MKQIYVRPSNQAVAAKAVEDGFTRFIVTRPMPGVAAVETLRLRDGGIFRSRKRIGDWVTLRSKRDEAQVVALKGRREIVVVDAKDWRVIPLENLIAALDGKTRLLAVARDAKEAEVFLTTLERGVDGVVVRPRKASDLAAFRKLALGSEAGKRRLVAAKVRSVEPIGMGERVCIDTVNILSEGEGMLIGSSSQAFFLIAAETRTTPFVRPRPFRVNAGAVHSYVLAGDNTFYLSELKAGRRLEAVSRSGRTRPVVVGRAKVESRPMLLVEASAEGKTFNVVLQNAETVRLAVPRARARSVTKLRAGDSVLVSLQSGARHFGMKIEERIEER